MAFPTVSRHHHHDLTHAESTTVQDLVVSDFTQKSLAALVKEHGLKPRSTRLNDIAQALGILVPIKPKQVLEHLQRLCLEAGKSTEGVLATLCDRLGKRLEDLPKWWDPVKGQPCESAGSDDDGESISSADD